MKGDRSMCLERIIKVREEGKKQVRGQCYEENIIGRAWPLRGLALAMEIF